jgi:vancomycin resistance protein YoaR
VPPRGNGRTRAAAGRISGSVRAGTPLYTSGARPRARGRGRSAGWTLAALVALVALLGVLIGLAFAGSSRVLAEGTHVAGIDVGGMTTEQAVDRLDSSFAEVRRDPVTFGAGDDTFAFAANQLGVDPDWRGAVAAAARAGDGFGPIRGFRRLHTRFFGAEILPRVAVSDAALEFALDRMASNVDRAPTSAAVVRRGLSIQVQPAEAGRRLARDAAARTVVRTLGSLERPGGVVQLRVATAAPPVTEEMLEPVARRARIALSAPVVLEGANRRWRLSRQRLAQLLLLPSDGAKRLTISGPRASAYFDALAERVGKPPVDAEFMPSGDGIQVVASRNGTELDVAKTAQALLRAATSRTDRVASVAVSRAVPDRTTREALAMGIDRRMASYKTWNSGTWDRIMNLRLGVLALDDTLVPPGGTFSLNDAIGERTVERGFRPAPVIIGTRYEEEVGGGTSQVATTVFNAAWEAGLNITERNPHSLYIDRYQLGRDATVYWPSLDLKFENDTKTWVLVKGTVEADGVRVSIYGGEDRRVDSSEGTREITGSPPVRRVKDPTLPLGTTQLEEYGSSPSRTSVERTVYGADGKVLRDETWTTNYRGEARVFRIGTMKPEPIAPPKKPKQPKQPAPPGDATTPPATQP